MKHIILKSGILKSGTIRRLFLIALFAIVAPLVTNAAVNIIGDYTGAVTVNTVGNLVHSITLSDAPNTPEILIGRKTDETIILNITADGMLAFRDADANGYIPIGSYSEFQLINAVAGANGADRKYKQEADLDLMSEEWMPIGTGKVSPVGGGYVTSNSNFFGEFDGSTYTIANLSVTGSNRYVGLFGYVGPEGRVSNVHIISGNVSGEYYVGGVCGVSFNGTITACYNTATIHGDEYVSGVCGFNGQFNPGGNVVDLGGIITACYNTGAINGGYYVSGICGYSAYGTIINASYNIGAVKGNYHHIGGVCGHNYGSMTACYNMGTIEGDDAIGGVCGFNGFNGDITACYNTGVINGGRYVGGVCGFSDIGASITACYWKSGTASQGVANGTTTTFVFSNSAWPSTDDNAEWGVGNSDGTSGNYWKTLGTWNDNNSVYPQLWFESTDPGPTAVKDIFEVQVKALHAYPNPISRGSNITVESDAAEESTLKIYNISGGSLVKEQRIVGRNTTLQLDVPAGNYILTLNNEVTKIVVK
ncbi:MAG: T9SS type A sorting domain-containing protein [Candidatus Symbiothrix sp.]|jgi:hypothetical protein|nr:T9SS type A sorting domain-containing protein [Candidatus Symbiothrix sp.]